MILTFLGSRVSMNLMEQIMSNLPCLRHFEVIADGSDDMIDGQRWERSAKNLLTLQFNFSIPYAMDGRQLDSFRTRFWLSDKQWFVAYANNRFFSVPHFMTREADEDYRIPQYTTVLDTGFFYQHMNTLSLTGNFTNEDILYPHIHTLALAFSPSIRKIRKAVNRRQIRNLSLAFIGEEFPIKSLINEMPNLSQLTIADGIETFLKNFRFKRLDKIQTLRISNSLLSSEEYNIGHLCTVFPNIQRLHVNHLCSSEQIFEFLHRLKYLSNASFYCITWDSNEEENCRLKIQSQVDQMRHRQNLNFTYRFDASRIFFWF